MKKVLLRISLSGLTASIVLFTVNCSREKDEWLPVVRTESVSGITASGATSGGVIIDDGGSEITQRGVIWNISDNPTIETNAGRTTDGSGIGEFISVVSGLSPSTTYFLRAYATTEKGTSYGSSIPFTTIDFALVTTAEVTNVTSISAISGGNIESDGGDEVTRGVVWDTRLNPTVEENTGKTINGRGVGSFVSVMTGLFPLTTYYVRAYASNNAGTSYGTEHKFTTGKPTILDHEIIEGSVEDIDGNIYRTVFIGSQEWMAENLKTTRYRDGSAIDLPADGNSWISNTAGAYGWYRDEESNKDTYGAIYNWYAVTNPSQLCPDGWRVPSDQDWTNLVNFVATVYALSNHKDNIAAIGNRLKSCRQVNSSLGGECETTQFPRWHQHERNYGLDDFGFSALPIGSRSSEGIYIANPGYYVQYWSTTENTLQEAFVRYITFDSASLFRKPAEKINGYAVRCVR
jgi:uncharacterized protein (TIGR02145 family)